MTLKQYRKKHSFYKTKAIASCLYQFTGNETNDEVKEIIKTSEIEFEITDENSMIQNLYSCLLTRKGERLFNPDFGTTIEERIFSLRTGGNPTDILKECITALETYEPRIQLVYEHCNITDMGQHGIYLTLGVIVPGGTVQTIDIPFKNRGRLV